MTKHILLTLLLFAITLSAQAKKLDDPIRFAIIGDRTGGHVAGVYGEIIEEIERLKPDFTMTVGDMIEGYSEDSTRLTRQWEEYQGLVKSLSAPIHYTPGNHDITYDGMLDQYQKFVGDPYYSFDYEDVHFVVMDNSRWNSSDEIPEEQIKWLTKDLKKHKRAPYTLVFFHKPFWFNSLAVGNPDKLHDIFVKNGVDAVFTGHFHTYFSGEYDGIKYTSMGSSGGQYRKGVTDLGFHYLWVTVNRDGIHVAPIKKGSVLPWDEVSVDDVHLYNNVQRSAISFDYPIKVLDGLVTQTPFIVTLANSSKFAIDDMITWDVPDGWTVEPRSMRLSVAAGESGSLRFTAACNDLLYPVPSLKFSFPYREGKSFEVESNLQILRTVNCARATSVPTIDGMVSEGDVWKYGETVFFPPEGGEPRIDPVNFHFAYDEENLYLGVVCQENVMDSLVADVNEHDGAVYSEDCVGFFLSPPTDSVSDGGGANYQIYFNANGLAFDQKISVKEGRAVSIDKEWTCTYEAKTVKQDRFWAIEAMIPFSQFNVSPKAGDQWLLNFRRKQARVGSSGDWIIPITFDPITYGVLIFE